MQTLEQILSSQKSKDNKNQRFPGSTSGNVFDRLGFNFDFPNPSVIEFSNKVKDQLNTMPKLLKDWQAEDLRNGTVINYYTNPLAANTYSLSVSAVNISTSCLCITTNVETGETETTIIGRLGNVYTTSISLKNVCDDFILHTNRLSNVVPVDTGEVNDPHFLTCASVGKVLLYITNQTDGISDSKPILGNFTSLFIKQDIDTSNNRIFLHANTIANSIEMVANTCYTTLENEEIEEIENDLTYITNLLWIRMNHDKSFWNSTKIIAEEYSTFKTINGFGNTEKYLVENYIGTDKLKESMNTPDMPSTKYDVTIDYFGNIKYTPNTA